MQLVNTTAVPAHLAVSQPDGAEFRLGILVAKATFRFDASGRVRLDTQHPHAVYSRDVETELGVLPVDTWPRPDAWFEVMLLGAAYPPRGGARKSRIVALTVGDVTRRLMISGDRRWESTLGVRRPSEAEPFARMPLTWERAHGGWAEVWLDRHTGMDVADPLNSRGRGFDAQRRAHAIGRSLGAAPGFPVVRPGGRRLPNVEHPAHRIVHWEDAPKPCCWSPVPVDIGMFGTRGASLAGLVGDREGGGGRMPSYFRAHPDWVVPVPEPGARVALAGLTSEPVVRFELPRLRVVGDYLIGARRGRRALAPQALVLLPEEERFYIVYRAHFRMHVQQGMERAFRLQIEEGWRPTGEDGAVHA